MGVAAGGVPQPGSAAGRLVYAVVAVALRRKGLLMATPVMYVALMLLLVSGPCFDAVPARVGVAILRRRPVAASSPPPPGAAYRSPRLFDMLWPSMEADTNHSLSLAAAWNPKASSRWKPCTDNNKLFRSEPPHSNGYLIVEANGGLNQQRLAICDAVAVARLLNATLVIPMFHLNSVWRDSSKFRDIFDEDFFIDRLRSYVSVVKEIPEHVFQRFDHNLSKMINMRAKAYSTKTYYLQKVLPKLLELGAVRIAPFSNRLAHKVPPSIQGLRCLANYEALRFSHPIRDLAEHMVDRMRRKALASDGKFIAIHLRFEEDMVAFSCCTYDGGKEEEHEMDKARERGWKGKFRRPGRVISPEANRIEGKCPLTPLEVGMMLRGMGFDNKTSIFVASGKIYNEKKYMAPLRQLFPRLETKETLANPEELAPFKGYLSRLAALDYTLCASSEVFVSTQGGNFPHFLMGQRRYLYEGHARMIKPDKRKLVLSFDNPNIRWDSFKRNMQEMLRHSDSKGVALRKADDSLYSFPMPDCMCQQEGEV